MVANLGLQIYTRPYSVCEFRVQLYLREERTVLVKVSIFRSGEVIIAVA